jgi:fumarylacetoacetate (FAA) hydrolase family protein
MIAVRAEHLSGASSEQLVAAVLPMDAETALLIGRVELPGPHGGPVPALCRDGLLYDLSSLAPTIADLMTMEGLPDRLRASTTHVIGSVGDALQAALRKDKSRPRVLAPIDLQCVKACGVTYVASMIERVIEERSAGDPAAADRVRRAVEDTVGRALADVRPGSGEAARVKQLLLAEGLWSHYLEVGIGPDCESFTKCPPLAAVGFGAEIGIRPDSHWNNPEPELVVIADPTGRIVGAALGNDVNLRDFEGRSPMLLDKAKDNNASCAVGPFIRLLDETFTLKDLAATKIGFSVEGADGFAYEGAGDVGAISRTFTDLVEQTFRQHQYPDGLALFTGTMWVPTMLRGEAPFTHAEGDWVQVWSDRLGRLANRTAPCPQCPPWEVGISALMRSLYARGLLRAAS